MSTSLKIKHGINHIRFYSSILVFAFYIVVVCLFVFTDTWIDLVPKGRGTIGLVLFLFGSFRFYIAFRRFNNKRSHIQSVMEIKQNVSEE
jgi:hypothetical protein